MTVPNGKTIVITGLIREDRTSVNRRVPILGAIPLLGVLFRSTVEGVERTNLIILVTPRVLAGEAAARAATEAWGRKTGLPTSNLVDTTVGPPLPPATP